jgi:hypothetical protein
MAKTICRGEVFISRETVEKLIGNMAAVPDGVDFGGILFFLELCSLS